MKRDRSISQIDGPTKMIETQQQCPQVFFFFFRCPHFEPLFLLLILLPGPAVSVSL